MKQHFSNWINNLNGIRRELDYKTPALKLGAAAMAMIMITSTWYSQRWSCYNNCCRLSYCYCHHQNKLGLNYTSFDEDGSLIEWWRTISSDIDIVAQFQANVSSAWHHINWAVPVPSLATPSKYKNLGESWRIFKHPRTFRGKFQSSWECSGTFPTGSAGADFHNANNRRNSESINTFVMRYLRFSGVVVNSSRWHSSCGGWSDNAPQQSRFSAGFSQRKHEMMRRSEAWLVVLVCWQILLLCDSAFYHVSPRAR